MAAERGLFRWAGAKRHLIDRVAPLIQAHRAATGGRLISGFGGSLAIERAAGGCAVAADASPELLQLYSDLQTYPPEVVHRAMLDLAVKFSFTPESYRELRAVTPEARRPLTSSARFLVLSTEAFNGIWRVNSRGEMNMPPDPARLALGAEGLPPLSAFQRFAEEIRDIIFVCGYEKALALAKPGDIGLFDPPYGVFDGYTADGFESRDHRLLASALREAFNAGVAVIGFNAPEAEGIYGHWAKCELVERPGSVSSDIEGRQKVPELVITAGLRGAP